MIEFSVSTVRGAAIQMRAKGSALCGKVVRTFCQQTGAVGAGDAVVLRSATGEKFAPDASLQSCGVVDGTALWVTEVVSPATILYRIVDASDNFLEMRSKNSVRVGKVLAGWRANCPAGSPPDANLRLVLLAAAEPAGTDLYLNEAFTLGEYGIKDGTTVRVVRADAQPTPQPQQPTEGDDSQYTGPPIVPPGLVLSPRRSAELATSASPASASPEPQVAPSKAPRVDVATAAPAAVAKKPSEARSHQQQQQQQQPAVKIDPADAYRAKWAFETDREREMSLRADDLVLVVRRKKEWWKGLRVRDGEIGWFPATRVVPATPDECLAIATAVAKVQRQPETIKRKERRAQASKGDGEKQLEDKFGAEAPPAANSSNNGSDAQKEIAELERLAAAHEADARRIVELMREGVAGRCGENGEIEYVPSEQGHIVRVNARPILLLHGDALEMVIGDDQSLKIEVLLNTVLSSFAFPFVTEFDGDNACLVLVGASAGRARLTAPCTVQRNGRVEPAAPLLAALAASSPTMPTTPRGDAFVDVARAPVADETLVRHAAWERSGKPRNENTAALFDVQSSQFRDYLQFWVLDRLLRIVCDDAQLQGDMNLAFRSDSAPECVEKLRRRLVSLVEATERSSYDYAVKLQLANSPMLGEIVSALFPVRASLLALQMPSRTSMAPLIKRIGERFMLIEGRLSAEAVVALDEVVRRPPRRASNHSEEGAAKHQQQQQQHQARPGADAEPRTCRARYTFQARKPEKDLGFNKGDVLRVLYQINDDWLFGTMGSREGRFPASFVEFIETPAPTSPGEQSAGLMTIRREEEMMMDSDGDDDDGGSEKSDDADKKSKAAAAEAAKKKAEADEAAAKKKKAEEDEAEEAAAAAAAAEAAELAAQRKAKEEAEQRAVAAAMAAAAAVDAAQRTASTGATAADAVPRTGSIASAGLRASPQTSLTSAESTRSLDAPEIAIEQIKSWRDVLNYAKLKASDIDTYVAQLEEHDVDFDQLYDVDIEVAKLVGIKAGHWLRLQKSIGALKEAGFEPS